MFAFHRVSKEMFGLTFFFFFCPLASHFTLSCQKSVVAPGVFVLVAESQRCKQKLRGRKSRNRYEGRKRRMKVKNDQGREETLSTLKHPERRGKKEKAMERQTPRETQPMSVGG